MTSYNESSLTRSVRKILGSEIKSKRPGDSSLRASVLKGFPFSAFEAVQKEIDLPQNQLSDILGIPARTMARRKNNHLSAIESDRLYRVAWVLAFATEVFGNAEKARVWLKSPNHELGDEVPLYFLDTDIGSRQVEEELQRIKYGIFG
jgi:putative toxin-antitoxin system antitoxin component (TIGR02293 family)